MTKEVIKNNEEDSSLAEQISVKIDNDRQSISKNLDINGVELDKALDDYIVDKTEYDITNQKMGDRPSDKNAVSSDLDEATIRTIDEVSEQKNTDTPTERLVDSGFEDETRENTEKFDNQQYRGMSVHDSILRIINYRREAHDNRMVKKTADMLSSDDNSQLTKFRSQVLSGKIDLGNERISSLYLNKIGNQESINSNEISLLVNSGVSLDKIVGNQHVADTIVNQTIKIMNNQLAEQGNRLDLEYNFPLNGALIQLIAERPNYNEKIANAVDIQTYGDIALENEKYEFQKDYFLDEQNKERRDSITNNLHKLEQLGFKPLSSEEDLQIVFDNSNSTTVQENLSSIGLINESTVDLMYSYKFKKMKEWAENGGHGDVPPILLSLEPSDDDKLAQYWHTQSDKIGKDSMELVMNGLLKINNNHYDSDVFEQSFDSNGIPTKTFFSNQYNFPMRYARSFNHEGYGDSKNIELADDIMTFFGSNLSMIDDKESLGFVKEYNSIDDTDTKKAFLLYSTGGQEHFFDEKGRTENFYRHSLQDSVRARRELSQVDPRWREHFTNNELLFIDFTEKYERISADLSNHGISIGEKINLYFDNNGPTNTFASDVYKSGAVTTLSEIPELVTLCSPLQQKYLNFLKQSDFQSFLIDIRPTENKTDYFDDSGATPKLWQLEFNNNEFDFVSSQTQETIDNMQLTDKQLTVINTFKNIDNSSVRDVFKKFVLDRFDDLSNEKLESIPGLLDRLTKSNASEMAQHSGVLAQQLLNLDHPEEYLSKIEEIFIHNNLPFVGKAYSVFKILHPADSLEKDFNISDSKTISPVLKEADDQSRQEIIFTDLLKCAFGSNNRSLRSFLSALEQNQVLIDKLTTNKNQWENLSDDEQLELQNFTNRLETIFENTELSKNNKIDFSKNYNETLTSLIDMFKPNDRYSLSDRITRMFAYPLGLHNFDEAVEYLDQSCIRADRRNRMTYQVGFHLDKGDFVKGIGNIKYLSNILQNGSVAQEFLDDSASSDSTPLDTDLSIIRDNYENIDKSIENTEAKGYGKIWFALKNNERFMTTRRSPSEDSKTEVDISTNQKDKFEVFYTGAIGPGHYGIRTGFPSTEIDCIITQNYDERIGLEIAKNGFYIPVVDRESGKTVFSPDDYDSLVKKMSGMSYYDQNHYQFAPNLSFAGINELAGTIEANDQETDRRRTAINGAISSSLSKIGLSMKNFDNTLVPGVELIDTGSTGRGTSLHGDGDFDFIMRVDKSDFLDNNKMESIKQALAASFNTGDNTKMIKTGNGDLRLKDAHVNGIEKPLDIDITFVEKSDKLNYSTEQALKDRLLSIKKQSPDRYYEVIANILYAKNVLKEAKAYKPNRGDSPQGGLGGVGIENWILQNGGSFLASVHQFLEAAKDKTFEEFKKTYYVWDFGENYLAARNGTYVHDNFVANMNSEGYEKMRSALAFLAK
jgi:hypothetical protein